MKNWTFICVWKVALCTILAINTGWAPLSAQRVVTLKTGSHAEAPPPSVLKSLTSFHDLKDYEKDTWIKLSTTSDAGGRWYVTGNINRVVMDARVPSGSELAQIRMLRYLISKGFIGRYAKLHIQARAVARDPNYDLNRVMQLKIVHVNGSDYTPGSNSIPPLQVKVVAPVDRMKSSSWFPGPNALHNSIEIPSELLRYGQPKIDHNTSLADIVRQMVDPVDPNGGILRVPNPLAPVPGQNTFLLEASIVGGGSLIKGCEFDVQAYLEIEAMHPILLLHGTAADHTAWEEDGGVQIKGLAFDLPKPWMEANCESPWFYKVDLTNRDNPPPLKKYVKGRWSDRHGNGGVEATGREINEILSKFILPCYGARNIHIVGHSKAGSDLREAVKILANQDQQTAAFRILSVFTLGTPHFGTIIADLAVIAGSNQGRLNYAYWGVPGASVSSDTASHLERCINVASPLDDINKVIIEAPSGQALLDQMLYARKDQYYKEGQSMIVSRYLNGQFYSFRGDADVDNNGQVDAEETQVLIPTYPLRYWSGRAMYQVIGRVDGVINERSWRPSFPLGYKLWSAKIRMQPNSQGLMPNDLCTRYDSGLGPGATPLRGRPNFTWGTSADPTKVRVPDDLIDPGNHTLMKNQVNLDTILERLRRTFVQ